MPGNCKGVILSSSWMDNQGKLGGVKACRFSSSPVSSSDHTTLSWPDFMALAQASCCAGTSRRHMHGKFSKLCSFLDTPNSLSNPYTCPESLRAPCCRNSHVILRVASIRLAGSMGVLLRISGLLQGSIPPVLTDHHL